MNLRAQIIEELGVPKFAVLPIERYELLLSELSEFDSIEDLADYLRAVKTRAETSEWHTLDQVKAKLGL